MCHIDGTEMVIKLHSLFTTWHIVDNVKHTANN